MKCSISLEITLGGVDSFVADMNTGSSWSVLIDALDIAAGPTCMVKLPARITSVTHATWAQGEAIHAIQG